MLNKMPEVSAVIYSSSLSGRRQASVAEMWIDRVETKRQTTKDVEKRSTGCEEQICHVCF